MTLRMLQRPALLILPLLAFLGIFYLVPVLLMLAKSAGPSLDFGPLLTATSSGTAAKVFGMTLKVAVIATFATLLLAYPLALFMTMARLWLANLTLALVMIPFWTSILVRSYAWMVLLGREGLINGTLIWMGITSEPIRLLNTTFAVYVGTIHILLPFMILPIYAVLSSLDGRLVRAAEGLGASTFQVMRLIVLPLSLPGVFAGTLIGFILALGFYVTPALLGGPSDMTVSMLIAQEVEIYEWDVASAHAALLLAGTLIVVLAFSRVVSLDRAFGGAR